MRRLPVFVLLFLLPALAVADEDEGEAVRRSRAAAAAMQALASQDVVLAAHGAYQAGRHGLHEVEPLILEWLLRQTHTPPAERSWAFVQILLDALVRLEATPPSGALMPHLKAHGETVVVLLALGRDRYGDELLALYPALSGHRQHPSWLAVGHALARAHPRRFMPLLLPEVRIRHEIVVSSPPRPGVSSGPMPPPRFDAWREQHPIPDGFPPVAVVHVRTRRGPNRSDTLPGVWLERTEHAGGVIEIERTARADVKRLRPRLQPRLRWLDLMLARAKVGRLPSLSARRSEQVVYAGPTPFRNWVLPHRERLLGAWWARVEGLLRGGFIDEVRAAALARSVDLILHDARRDRNPSLYPLPATRAKNPFRPRKRADFRSL